MKEQVGKNKNKQEPGEEQLSLLIKQAGDESRARNREAMERHMEKLRAAIAEGVARWQTPVTS